MSEQELDPVEQLQRIGIGLVLGGLSFGGLSFGVDAVVSGIVLMAVGILAIPSAIFQAAEAPVIGDLVTAFVNSLMFTIIYGIMAAMYVQLRDGDDDNGTPGSQPSPLGQTAD